MRVAIPSIAVTPLERLELARFLGRRDELATVEEVRAFALDAIARRFREIGTLAPRSAESRGISREVQP